MDDHLDFNDDLRHKLILERNKDIKEIEYKTTKLNELFRDLSILVDDHGEIIDDIDHNVMDSLQNTDDGIEYIEQLEIGDRKHRLCNVL